jgi:hypothetical protein
MFLNLIIEFDMRMKCLFRIYKNRIENFMNDKLFYFLILKWNLTEIILLKITKNCRYTYCY